MEKTFYQLNIFAEHILKEKAEHYKKLALISRSANYQSGDFTNFIESLEYTPGEESADELIDPLKFQREHINDGMNLNLFAYENRQ